MEFHPEQKADEGAVAEQAAANDEEGEADAELLNWACPTIGVDPELAQADPEQLKMDRETVNERAVTNAELAKADAELLKKQKEFWSYIVIFFPSPSLLQRARHLFRAPIL